MKLKQIIYSPVWLFELFTSAKSFRGNPLIGSYWLNRMGLHVIRLVGAHLIMQMRLWMLSLPISVEDRRAYQQKGYLLKENFLSTKEFAALAKEVANFSGETREARQGDTITQRSVLPPELVTTLPAIKKLFAQRAFRRFCSYTAGHIRPPLFYIETVMNESLEAAADPQKNFHTDTFHPTMKCWYFMHDVKVNSGPLTFIPGSHKLTWKRIKWEYKMSLSVKNKGNSYSSNGSFRFTAQDCETLGFAEPISFTVAANTLLFANTFGVHRRGDSNGRTSRTSIWGDSRTNPFIPFPGLSGDWINRLQYWLLADFRRRADEKAAQSGHTSPWRIVEKN